MSSDSWNTGGDGSVELSAQRRWLEAAKLGQLTVLGVLVGIGAGVATKCGGAASIILDLTTIFAGLVLGRRTIGRARGAWGRGWRDRAGRRGTGASRRAPNRKLMARRWQNVAALTVACALTVAPGFGIRPARAQVATILPAGTPSLNGLTRYQIDADDSSLEFRVAFMGVSTVHGNFTSYEGTMMYDPQHVNRTSITLAILTESINTAVPARDRDLRSPNFFDAKKYPVIMFTSTAVKASRYANSMDVIGNLTMHGTTRPIVLALYNQHRLVKDAWQNRRIGFFGAAGVNRKDFGIDGIAFWNNEFDPGRRAISDKVEINFEIEAELVNMDTRDFPKAQALIARIDGEGLTAVAASLKRAAPDAKSDAYPAFRSMLVNAAAKLRQRGRFADGAGLYTVLTDLDGKDAEAFAGLGELEFFLGERQRAVADFKRAVEADPTSTMALEYLRHLPQ